MHSYLSNTTQPHPTADYTIFVAEVASTFNEQLLTADLLARTDDPRQRAYLINDALETFRGTVYRQTQFAEFELLIHQIVESGEGLTPERLSAEYGRLVGEYYGPELVVDEQVSVEWGRIPHFDRAYYVYQYSTGLIASMALAAAVSARQPEARERYLRFLSSGSSRDSLELLGAAGVDLTTEVPYAAAFQTVERYLDELERLL
jgi:oligoendopeptidase F